MGMRSYVKDYEVRYYEVDYKRRLLITNLMNYFSDIAMEHSDKCDIGLDFLMKKNLAWVLYEYDIELFKHAYYGEKVKITTTTHGFKKFFAFRLFKVEDEHGEIIAKAKSNFIMIDYKKRKPVRLAEEFYKGYDLTKDMEEELDFDKLEKLNNISEEKSFTVRYSDIDSNTHVNNVKYVEWLIEPVPLEIVKNNFLKRIKIKYVKECLYGDTINSKIQIVKEQDGIKIIHKIVNHEDKELTIAETYWSKEPEENNEP